MEAQAIFDHLAGKLGDAVSDFAAAVVADAKAVGGRDASFKVKPERWLEVATVLRDDPALRFDFCQNITAVDWIKQAKLEVVYHFWSYALKHQCVVRVDLPRDKPEVASVAGLWKTADWNEREQFDLLGVSFLGHPDLRRILLPDDWPGYPMRKDYKEAESYRGMPTTRPNTLELLPMYDKAPAEKKTPAAAPAGESDE